MASMLPVLQSICAIAVVLMPGDVVVSHASDTPSARGVATAKDGNPFDDTDRLLEACRRDWQEYKFEFVDDSAAKLEVKEVLKWTNPVRDRQLGVVNLIIHAGRPEAIATVFMNPKGQDEVVVMHEFQSLSMRRLRAVRRDGQIRWSPNQPGIMLKVIPNAPEPADSLSGRLRQMRSLAREFSAHSVSYYGDVTRWELRLLAQPLYRYEVGSNDLLDGALFAFVSSAGTDPELLLPIEARKVDGRWVWHGAGARFSDHSLHLHHRDRDMWSFTNDGRSPDFQAGQNDVYRIIRDRVQAVSTLSR